MLARQYAVFLWNIVVRVDLPTYVSLAMLHELQHISLNLAKAQIILHGMQDMSWFGTLLGNY
ncbi:hypothetical protein MU1_14920 [Paenibacillus glycanilyticus]|uniref:Uncharacterized protein n=1 Tax=Paenibacillus glycanilyticus TaxID=126569 RepID=A0ABQ6GA76_9BACL|nr:hypothetical protein MU1_14920 [Paenibacillus glycanilyticus]